MNSTGDRGDGAGIFEVQENSLGIYGLWYDDMGRWDDLFVFNSCDHKSTGPGSMGKILPSREKIKGVGQIGAPNPTEVR